jgi:hypothetical protein
MFFLYFMKNCILRTYFFQPILLIFEHVFHMLFSNNNWRACSEIIIYPLKNPKSLKFKNQLLNNIKRYKQIYKNLKKMKIECFFEITWGKIFSYSKVAIKLLYACTFFLRKLTLFYERGGNLKCFCRIRMKNDEKNSELRS